MPTVGLKGWSVENCELEGRSLSKHALATACQADF